ncbi:hypothetical protein [Massilia sp. TSP1-1-2]|uniref:hypothetical protein n=1 Tax=Massilia sp. TSP1-1-2 TaxID=2804649 RepID=UPI003CF0D721
MSRTEKKQDALLAGGGRYCSVAAAVFGGAIVGGIASSSASGKASKAAANSAAASAESQERIAKDQLDFAKTQDADNKIRFAKADALTEKVTNKQLDSMDQNMALAKDYDEYNKGTFRPLEQSIVSDAEKFDTPEEQERAAGAASASVKQNITQATEANARAQARMGVNPNSGRATVMQNESAITGALGEASAENSARMATKTLGAAKRMDAASLGRNLPSAQATSAGLGISAGQAAIAGTAQTNGTAISGATAVGGLYGQAGAQYGHASQNYSNVSNAASKAAADSAAAWGQIGGMGMSYLQKPPTAGGVPNAQNVMPSSGY